MLDALSNYLPCDAKVYQVIKSDQDQVILQNGIENAVRPQCEQCSFTPKSIKLCRLETKNYESIYYMTLGGHSDIPKVDDEKDLGVTVDNKLTFRQHIASKVSTANRNLGITFNL